MAVAELCSNDETVFASGTTRVTIRGGALVAGVAATLLLGSCGSDDASRIGASNVTETHVGNNSAALIVYQWGAPCGQDAPGPLRDGLCVVDEDGTDARAILTDLGGLQDPDWSRDGRSIVFARSQVPGQLWIAETESRDAHPVLEDSQRCHTEARVPSWSPDGTRIAFMCLNNSQTEIAIADVATGAVTSVYVAAEGEEAWNPRWSPDGERLVFERDSNDGVNLTGAEIVVTSVAGGVVDVVVPAEMFAGWPDWSPKGDLIVFETYGISVFETGGPGATNLYTVAPDGSQLKQLTTNELGGDRDSQPSFTPDGERVIFTHTTGRSNAGYGLRRAAFIGLDGTGLTVVDTVYATHPRLQPAS